MTRNRFEETLRYLHCNDNGKIPQQNKDKLYKVRPLATTLNDHFQALYKTTSALALTRACLGSKTEIL